MIVSLKLPISSNVADAKITDDCETRTIKSVDIDRKSLKNLLYTLTSSFYLIFTWHRPTVYIDCRQIGRIVFTKPLKLFPIIGRRL